jgi:peptidoglycan hydrolase-like protein with peptidoglycan-binding domain
VLFTQWREKRRQNQCEGDVRTLVRKFLLGTGSVLALAMAGEIATGGLDNIAGAGNAARAADIPVADRGLPDALASDPLRTNDVRWAQLELRRRGLYQGSLDGIVGPQTRHGLSQFQKITGLGPTASLDAQTWKALTGSGVPPIAEGSEDGRPPRG